jgi:hypothetical protein
MNNENLAINEARNKKRVFDQMASMHFKLSDEYRRWARFEDAIEIAVAVSLCGVTFLNFQNYFNITIENSTLIVGGISIFLLIFIFIKQRIGHRQLSEKHQLAGKLYTKAKLDLTSMINMWITVTVDDSEVLSNIDNRFGTLNDLPQIPEKHFSRLKHAHQSKVAMSKFLDSHPNDFWLLCKLKFRLGSICKKNTTDI